MLEGLVNGVVDEGVVGVSSFGLVGGKLDPSSSCGSGDPACL